MVEIKTSGEKFNLRRCPSCGMGNIVVYKVYSRISHFRNGRLIYSTFKVNKDLRDFNCLDCGKSGQWS